MEACYRHPDRETGVSCSSCGRPICPECMTATQVGMRCPECASQRTPVRTMASLRADPTLTYVLVGINVLVFLGSMFGGGGLVGGGISPLDVEGALVGDEVAAGELWRLVTGGFLHAGIAHLFLNMFLLYILGGMLEPAIGRLRFGVIYFVSLLCGSFGALLLSPAAFTRGASGAVFGLMAATFVVMRTRGIDPMQSGIGPLILLNLVITFLLPGISIGGHIGGLVGGGLAALLMFDLRDRVRIPAVAANALAAGLGVLAVVGSLAVVSG
ncbi:MAG TPA: rhomboid family intramembrane serine protease [Solirubrobacteraceae bacterium]|nr:rhomboid family intramembrane serine protease [Solirubrobacteraceae bacterium]